MRYLHPVTPHETFVASGVYEFSDKSIPSEEWSIHELPDGAQLARIDRSGKGLIDLTEVFHIRSGDDWKIERYDVYIHYPEVDWKPLRESYVFFDNYVEVMREKNYAVREQREVPLPVGCRVCPPGILNHRFLMELAKRNQEKQPVFEGIDQMMDYSVSRLADEPVTTGGKTIQAQRYAGKKYSKSILEEFDLYLNLQGIPVRFVTAKWEVLLTQYAQRPEPKPR